MAMQETASAPSPSAEVVGNAFVEQYYRILHQSPELVHRFYQDSSLLSRPKSDGGMTTVTTTQAINDQILSLNYEGYTAEIKTADAQQSYEKGVIVLVTGCLIGKDNVKKRFMQTFFLAPQEKGYFVLNDVFRFVEETETLPISAVLVNGIHENAPPAALMPEADPSQAADHAARDPTSFGEEGEDLNDRPEVYDPSDVEEGSVIDEEFPADPTHSEIVASVDIVPATVEDVPKKSYASILKVMKGSQASTRVYVPTNSVKVPPAIFEQPSINTPKPASPPEALAPASGSATESTDVNKEAEGHSIYVRNLPYNATVAHLDEVFKKFGPIKHNGIQVRSSKQGFCFGFVEFETLSSMHSAIEASPINIGDRPAVVEEKRTNTRVSISGKGKSSLGRIGFRNESFKSRGNTGSGRGYGRNEFRNQSEISGRPRGSSGHSGEDYQPSNQNDSRRGGRKGGEKGSVST